MKIAKALFRKKRKSESYFKYILFLLHMWLGLIVGVVVSFVSITGALYVFKSEIEDLSAYSAIHRKAPAQTQVASTIVLDNFKAEFNAEPSIITIPENAKRNIRVSLMQRGKPGVIAFADRETGEITGRVSTKVSQFFSEIMFLHRWFSMENRNVGKQIVGASTLIFLLLLISGVIMWFPKLNSKNPWRNKLNMGFRFKFKVWNRNLHINMGMFATLFLLVIGWTGMFFTYEWVRTVTVDSFKPKTEAIAAVNEKPSEPKREARADERGKPSVTQSEAGSKERGKLSEPKGETGAAEEGRPSEPRKEGNAAKPDISNLNFDAMLIEANQRLNYSGDVSIMLSGKGVSSPTVRKLNTHNLLGARLYDDVKFGYNGKLKEVSLFKNKETYEKIRGLIKSIHTGEVLGLKSKIFNFILALFAAYLPISGYIMWFNKLKVRNDKVSE